MKGERKDNSVQVYVEFIDYVISDVCEPAYSGTNKPPCGKEVAIHNLLSDLLHYCKEKDISFSCQLDKAARNFARERERYDSDLRRRETRRKKVSPI